MKIAVYTALYGEKDILRPPNGYSREEDISYFVFSDNELDVPPYQNILKPIIYEDVAKNARYFKIMGDTILSEYDILIWHDANIQLEHTEIKNLVTLTSQTFLTTFAHPNRNDFYSEAMTCIRVEKDFSLRLLKQSWIYFLNGMPAHHGLCSTGILIKNYDNPPGNALEFWWQQTLKYSRRDQLSLAYTIFRQKLNITLIREDILNNKYSKYHLHNHTYYEEKSKVMSYNFWIFKQISFYGVKLIRKIKKMQ